jgi:hypothetical protein
MSLEFLDDMVGFSSFLRIFSLGLIRLSLSQRDVAATEKNFSVSSVPPKPQHREHGGSQ